MCRTRERGTRAFEKVCACVFSLKRLNDGERRQEGSTRDPSLSSSWSSAATLLLCASARYIWRVVIVIYRILGAVFGRVIASALACCMYM